MNDSARSERLGFRIASTDIRNAILIPKYYSPSLAEQVEEARRRHETSTLRELSAAGAIEVATGDEIGKLSYGTGSIPFVRTSDIANWEIKSDPKHAVSQEIYERYAVKQDVQPDDILFVRDGTYLIGSLAIVTAEDLPMLYQSHIVKIRVVDRTVLSPFLLIGMMQSSIVQRQLRSQQFTADIIDSVGDRYLDVVLPFPHDKDIREDIAARVERVVTQRAALRRDLRELSDFIETFFEG